VANLTLDEVEKPRPADEQADFVLEFVHTAEKARAPFEDIWDEVEANFLVRPMHEQNLGSNTKYPFAGNVADFQTSSGHAILKDPETHQSVMSIIAGIVLSLYPEDGFVRGRRRGFEDIYKAKTVNGLMEYSYRLEGEFLANIEWLMGAGIYGTGIGEEYWDYIEEPRNLRSIEFNPELGQELSESQTLTVPVYDDPRFEAFSIRDFFPDTGKHTVGRMRGAVRRFKIMASDAMEKAEAGIYEKKQVEAAIDSARSNESKDHRNAISDETGLYHDADAHPDFLEMTGFRYCGAVPFKSEDGFMRREVVVINGETVRSEVWARRLPWFECKITPRLGSFYGISPGELIRYDQDYVDFLKMMMADSVARMVHPPLIYDRNAEVNQAKLRAWKPGVPIAATRTDAVQQVPYNPPLADGFAMYAQVKTQMREGPGSLNANQGIGLGSKRFSASEALGTFERAGARPEMFNRVLEQEYMPPRGKYRFKLYGEFLEDTEDLALRIGESETTVALADILEDYDIAFVGSRNESTREQEMQMLQQIIPLASTPFAPLIPWLPLFRKLFDKMGLHEIAAMVGNEQLTQLNVALTTMAGPQGLSGNGNGTTPRSDPVGALPAQLFGGPQT